MCSGSEAGSYCKPELQLPREEVVGGLVWRSGRVGCVPVHSWIQGQCFKRTKVITATRSPVSAEWLLYQREFVSDNLLVRIHFIIKMIWWTGLAPSEFEFPSPGSLISTFQVIRARCQHTQLKPNQKIQTELDFIK